MTWAQRHRRLWLDGMARRQTQAKTLGDAGDDQLRFDQGEMVADAQARAPAEREVGEARPSSRARGREALRIEGLRVLPEIRTALGDVGA